MAADAEPFSRISHYTLANRQGMVVRLTNLGATLTSIEVPDREGRAADVVLGYDSAEAYLNACDHPYFGATCGRYANRIARGRFSLDGKKIQLNVNNGRHHLHGGHRGFDRVVWEGQTATADHTVILKHLSPHGEEHYPGNLDVTVTFTLTERNELQIDYRAICDLPTVVNLTNHAYFNLAGEGAHDILDHQVMIAADEITATDDDGIPTGTFLPVEGTPFDFREPKPVGRDIGAAHPMLTSRRGYDHNYALAPLPRKSPVLAARVLHPKSGRRMDVLTTAPGLQFYTGNFLDGRLHGKSGHAYAKHSGLCLETQHFPDSPNHPNFPTTTLRPGEIYTSRTCYAFSTAPD